MGSQLSAIRPKLSKLLGERSKINSVGEAKGIFRTELKTRDNRAVNFSRKEILLFLLLFLLMILIYFSDLLSSSGKKFCQMCFGDATWGANPCHSMLCDNCVVTKNGNNFCPVHRKKVKLVKINENVG